MGSSGKGGIVKSVTQGATDLWHGATTHPLDTVIKGLSNYATLGLAQYDPSSGKWSEGVVSRSVDEGIGEIDGRNKARGALNDANDAETAAEAAQAKLLADQQLNNYRADVNASRSAEGARNTAIARSQAGSMTAGGISGVLGQSSQDILGA